MIEINSCPIKNSDLIGSQYISSFKDNQEALGQYFTPIEVANYMASMLEVPKKHEIKILDPGAGGGVLVASAIKWLVENDKKHKNKNYQATLYEIDKKLIPSLEKSMIFLQQWCLDYDVSLKFNIENNDYILSNASALSDTPSLFSTELFDIVISNPPYFKISKEDTRALACTQLVYGQPNIYSLFMGVAASQLEEGGQFLFITPRSFSSGQYFKAFRNNFFEKISLQKIHIFESRTDAFNKDSVLQENIICYGHRNKRASSSKVFISSSAGKHDLANSTAIDLNLSEVLDVKNDQVLALPTNEDDMRLFKKIKSWGNSLEKMKLKISTGPVVPFRSTEFLKREELKESVPLLWIQHVVPMKTKFPLETFRKEQWIVNSKNSSKLLVENQNMILMRRFSPKEDFRRLTVAPYIKNQLNYERIGLENHLNYIYSLSKELSLPMLYGLCAYLNSKIFDSFFRITNGNTQVSATELKAAPFPDVSLINEIGNLILKSKNYSHLEIDSIVNEVLEIGEAS